jgi:hypothetical protein
MEQMNRRSVIRGAGLALLGTGVALASEPQTPAQRAGSKAPAPSNSKPDDCNCSLATDGSPLDTGTSEVRPVIERYEVDLRDLNRVYAIPGSALRQAKLEKFYTDQLQLLEKINFDALSQPGKVDYLLIRERLLREQKQLVTEGRQDAEVAALIPFQQMIIGFEEARRRMDTINPQKSAATLVQLNADIIDARSSASSTKAAPAVLNRAAVRLSQLRNTLRVWFNFYDLYDPKFSWWVDAEYKKADEALDGHAQFLHSASGVPGPLEAGAGAGGRGGGGGGRGARTTGPLGSNEELSGVGPAGNDALLIALQAAMIPYTPDELIIWVRLF